MKIELYNLYHLKGGTIELNDFSVIVGKNNTNKTTLAQAIDVMFSPNYTTDLLTNYFTSNSILKSYIAMLMENKSIKIDLVDVLDTVLDDFFEYEYKRSTDIIGHTKFSIDLTTALYEGWKKLKGIEKKSEEELAQLALKFFKKTQIESSYEKPTFKRSLCNSDRDSDFMQMCYDILLSYELEPTKLYKKHYNTPIIEFFALPDDDSPTMIEKIARQLASIYASLPIFTKNIHFFPVGRDMFLQYADNFKFELDEKVSNDFLDFYKSHIRDQKDDEDIQKSFCYDEIVKLEKEIFGGGFYLDDRLDSKALVLKERLKVVDKSTKKESTITRETNIKEFSSSAKALSVIIYYLKYLVKEGDFIIIDEPEMSLHPASVKVLIETLDNISKKYNVKVLIITHNDVILESIKNIALASDDSSYISVYEAKKDSAMISSIDIKDSSVYIDVYNSLRENRVYSMFEDKDCQIVDDIEL
jgi:predicted ATPase